MSVSSFIPQVWDARLLANLNNDLVYANLLNRDYEGDISGQGDTVHINSIGHVTVKKYTKNTDIDAPEDLTTTDQTLLIDQSDYFNFAIDDVDKAQIAGDAINTSMADSAQGLAENADKYVASLLKAGTAKVGSDTTPIVITKDNAYDELVELSVALDKAKCPKNGRWVVVDPDFYGFLLKDDRFIHATQTGDAVIASASVGRGAGFTIYESNNVPNTSSAKYKIIASTSMSATYADQISKTEAFRPDNGFKDAVKGLHVYGAKVTRPEIVGVLTCNYTAAA